MSIIYWIGGDSAGAGDWSISRNWSTGTVPVNSDIVYIDGPASTNQAINAGLNQSAVTLASLHILGNYTGTIGTASAYLQIGATNCYIHEDTGYDPQSGSTRIKINFGSVQTAVEVFGSATSTSDTGLEPIRLIGTHASNTLRVTGNAIIGVATTTAAETATFATVSANRNDKGTPSVNLGVGCTLTEITVNGGEVTNRDNAATTVTVEDGKYIALGAGAHTTIKANRGTVEYNSSGTITNLFIGGSGILDFTRDARAKTVENCSIHKGGTLKLDNGNSLSVTFTTGIDFVYCAVQEVTLQTWRHVTATLSAIS